MNLAPVILSTWHWLPSTEAFQALTAHLLITFSRVLQVCFTPPAHPLPLNHPLQPGTPPSSLPPRGPTGLFSTATGSQATHLCHENQALQQVKLQTSLRATSNKNTTRK